MTNEEIEVRAFGEAELASSGDDQESRDFARGVIAAAEGAFHEDRCKPRGTRDESAYCEGGREGLRLLQGREGALNRMQHGDTFAHPML
jgi:hypothetical protein